MSSDFLGLAVIFLSAAVVAVTLFQRLGLGNLLGYLVAGLMIGPQILGLISNPEDVMHVSELGIVFFLFIVGLELDPAKLWTLRKNIIGLGTLQVILSAFLIFLLGLFLDISFQALLVASMGLALSSTAIGLQILKDRNSLNTRVGEATFSILLFQDLAFIPMIAMLPFLADSQARSHFDFIKAVTTFTFLGVIFFVMRPLIRILLRVISSTGVREVFTAFSILLVVGMAALMNSLGLSMGLGAFLAGVILANSEYRVALETDIEPFKALLLGLFFMSVGMNLDLQVIQTQPFLVFGILCASIGIKLLVLYGIGRWSVPRRDLSFFAILLSQVGEFAFVLFSAARNQNILDVKQASSLIAATALSMAATPLLLLFYEKVIFKKMCGEQKKEYDRIPDEEPQVLIAGFGRFGQIIGRLLMANGIRSIVLDQDPATIELLRRFGFKVYYGDATRLDLLEAAGIRKVKLFVNAIDNVDTNLKLVDLVKKEYPHLEIICRARNVQHYYDLLDRGIKHIERETFDSSLKLGIQALSVLGWPRYEAHLASQKFRDHNLKLLSDLYSKRNDQSRLTSAAIQGRQQLDSQFRADLDRRSEGDEAWHDHAK